MARRNIDRQALRQQIQELDIDNELKSQLLDAVSEQKKYGLVWENHKEDAEEQLREKIPVLTEEKQLSLLSSPEGRLGGVPNHILIEGDNLHALTALTYTHEGKVDVIYIDPPYNTGNKDFVYNDSFVDSEDGYRHSKWLSFMNRRLILAKRLLTTEGCIFISIDNNEQAQLKLLCDSIFGESNFASTLHVEMSATQGMKVKAAKQGNIVKNGEYILVYKMGGSKNVGTKGLFYVDFVIRMQNGQILLFDTKSCGSDEDAPQKHNALLGYMNNEENEPLNLKGGVLIQQGDNWMYSENEIKNTTDISNWTAFYPSDYKSIKG